MRSPRQGEVWWAALPPPAGRRPVLILTRTDAIAALANVTVAPLCRTRRAIPSEVELGPADGLPTACAASLENVLTISRSALQKHIATLSGAQMASVFYAVRYVFAMD